MCNYRQKLRGLLAPLKRFSWKKVFKTVSLSIVLVLVLLLGTVFSIRWINPSLTAFTLQEDWDKLEVERYSLREYWVDYDSIPDNIKWAVVASEDQLFWEHSGLDTKAIEKALDEKEKGERVRGASTITQQVAKNLFLNSSKSYVRKGIEAGLALSIEVMWPKERILEVYLNIAEFGPGVYGVGKATNHFFDKDAQYLKADEAARMAAVLPNPKRMRVEPASPYVEKRKSWILRNMMNLSGVAYYKKPVPEQAPDSSTVDTNSVLNQFYIPKADISVLNLNMEVSNLNGIDSTEADQKYDTSRVDSTEQKSIQSFM